MKTAPCKICTATWHTKSYHTVKERKPLQNRSTLSSKTRLKPVGKQGKKTAAAVAAWKRKQKPNSQGLYECYMCHKLVPYLMAEHIKSKARHPELRTDPNNLKPTCSECNERKGSLDN